MDPGQWLVRAAIVLCIAGPAIEWARVLWRNRPPREDRISYDIEGIPAAFGFTAFILLLAAIPLL